MVLSEILPEEIDIKILATDISRKAVSRAVRGEYAPEIAGEVEKCYIQKYFTRGDGTYQVAARIRDLVTFRIFNLMEPFSFRRDFDLILCRNVMIYFDKETQKRLVQKMYDVLAPGGLFFIGHSEGLVHKEHKFRFIQPSVYVK
jgi:chemotaxis protein methyltransferase CheR